MGEGMGEGTGKMAQCQALEVRRALLEGAPHFVGSQT